MGPYSHYYLAVKLQSQLHPAPAEEYAWGAVAPDIRYTCQMCRDQTHLAPEVLAELPNRYPRLASFVLGYQVHCRLDQIDVGQWLSTAFPLRILGKRLSPQQATMLVEMFFLRRGVAGPALSGRHNELLADLGVAPEHSTAFATALQSYITAHSLDGAVSAFQQIGMIENSRVEKYRRAYESLRGKKLLLAILLWGVRNTRIEQRAVEHVLKNRP
ncbi:MAG: hypothetical protein JW987_00225 [Anaerolineaceae bacterium]|nr:hypothetical protein [Anaerolineaceae bacterium]